MIFNNLRDFLRDAPLGNIMNYDKINLCDDPKRKKVLAKQDLKHPERIMNSTKSVTLIIYAAYADGLLPVQYGVYKATNVYDTWKPTMGDI